MQSLATSLSAPNDLLKLKPQVKRLAAFCFYQLTYNTDNYICWILDCQLASNGFLALIQQGIGLAIELVKVDIVLTIVILRTNAD